MVSRVTFLFLLYVAVLDLREILGYSFRLTSHRNDQSIASFGTFAGNEKTCPRKTTNLHRTCLKRCTKDSDCVSKKKRCLCDGDCGMSCINKNIRCKNLNTKIQNGHVDILPYNQFGAIAKYTCAEGFKLFGKDTRICQGDETWSGEPPRCVINDTYEKNECQDPPKVHHAEHDGPESQKTYPVGHMLEYRCKEGFTARRDSVLRAWCVGGDVWVGPNMTCTHAGCPLLDQIENGQVDIEQPNMIGTTAKYTCSPGFHLAGRAIRTCTSDGTWDGKEPSCERGVSRWTTHIPNTYGHEYNMCSHPPTIRHAHHNAPRGQETFSAGTEIVYECDKGFNPNGHPRAMCREDGSWSGPRFSCTRQHKIKQDGRRPPGRNCGPPGDLINGRYEINEGRYKYPPKVTYHCNEGYELQGRSVRICQANGDWSGVLPSCKPIKCPILHSPLNGYMSGNGNTFNTVLKFSCKEGFKVVGSTERRCMSDGQWSGQPARCEGHSGGRISSEINCGLPGPLYNGYLDGHRKTVGAVFFFRCNVRTTFDGPSFSTQCQENGAWTHPPPKCWGQCQVPSIVNGSVMHGREGVWVDHETFINFRCRDGLVLNDTADVRCNNGSWTLIPRCIPGNEASTKKAPCSASPPNIENGRRVYIGWKHGDRAKYMCLQGFRLRGDKYMTCQYGRWKGSRPYCDEIYCPNPGTISNGKIHKKGQIGKFEFKAYIVTIRHGDRLSYECDRGYELLGPSGATCVDGQWSPEERPICKRSSHPALQKLWKPIEEGPSNY